jgi:cation diffusion facilitator CzcD-associated flavoprotein CzcO
VSIREIIRAMNELLTRINLRLPEYPGLDEYKGHIRHTSKWDSSFDPVGKTIAVIGNGASGIQVLPQLQKVAKRIDHFARSRTWIFESFGSEKRSDQPVFFTEEQLKSFEDDLTYYNFRKNLENGFYKNFFRIFSESEKHQAARKDIIQRMAARLQKKPDLLASILPDFPPFCRRPTPGPGYLEALTEDNVNYISTPIQKFTETGIVTTDGVARDVDAIICATGANVDFAPAFPIVANGIDLNKAWKPDGEYTSPYSYFGVATPYFPNLFFSVGPNSFGLSGTLNHSVETVLTYIAKALRKMTTQGIKTMVPSKAATDDFVEYIDAFFAQTVLSDNCSSWYNGK